MKKHIIAFMLILCLACLSGCVSGDTGSGDSDPASQPGSSGSSAPADQGEGEIDSAGNSGMLIREDSEGLVSVRIEGGVAELLFDLDQWDKLHDIYENPYFSTDSVSEGPFAIQPAGVSLVKDVCIAKIDDMFNGYMDFRDFVTPTVALLIEDGSLEFLRADPLMEAESFGGTFYSRGKLPWLKDIASLFYENEREGIGGMTIFAEDRDGLIYNVQRLTNMVDIFDEEWLFKQDREGFGDWRYCSLRLFEDNNRVVFETGIDDGWGIGDYGIYEGTYEISLAENDPGGRQPGLITFDLTMTDGDTQNERIVGTYFIQARDGITMELWHSDGDHLSYMEDEPITDFFFRSSDSE